MPPIIQSGGITKNTERLKFQDFIICTNILHVDVDAHWTPLEN